MAEFISSGENFADVGESIFFENKTDSSFEVSAGIVFHKSGLYEVSIIGNKTIVSKVSKATQRKKGEWLDVSEDYGDYDYRCSICHSVQWDNTDFCPDCGADMRGDKHEVD